MFLVGPGHKTGDVNERNDRDIETVTSPDKAGAFFSGVDVQNSGQYLRLVGYHPHYPAADAPEAANEVQGPQVVVLEELASVQHGPH